VRHERPAEQRAADRVECDPGSERTGQARRERRDACRAEEQRVEVEPQLAVVAGLQPKMSATPVDEREQFLQTPHARNSR
jgi:hypothetical protein